MSSYVLECEVTLFGYRFRVAVGKPKPAPVATFLDGRDVEVGSSDWYARLEGIRDRERAHAVALDEERRAAATAAIERDEAIEHAQRYAAAMSAAANAARAELEMQRDHTAAALAIIEAQGIKN